MTNPIKIQFDDFEWHDATLLCIDIDRRDPGNRDEVALVIEWPDGGRKRLVFTDCYALDARLNFGIVALESILGASCVTDCPRVAEVRATWSHLSADLSDLLCFEIETNSTSGMISIVARGFEVSNPPDDSWFPPREPEDQEVA